VVVRGLAWIAGATTAAAASILLLSLLLVVLLKGVEVALPTGLLLLFEFLGALLYAKEKVEELERE